MKLTHGDGRVEVLRPDEDFLALDCDLVTAHRSAFRVVVNPLSPPGREARALRRELADIEAKLAGGSAAGMNRPGAEVATSGRVFGPTGMTDASHRRRALYRDASWRLT
jgi:hypothetical protein